MTSLSELAAAAAIVGLLAWIALRWRRNRSAPLLLALAACALLVLPSPSHALDFRRSEHGTVLIPAGETIDDTLVAFGETVEVNGDVEGDLIAAARRVVIRGQIGGQVITAAENVTIAGRVTNSVVAFARAIEVLTPALGGNLFAFGAEIDTGQQTTIDGNAVLFGERNRLAGPVGKDVVAFAEQLEVGSSVGGGLMFFGNQLRLLAPARITGNVTARVPDDDHVSVSPGAVIGGEVKTEIMEHPEPDSDYTSFGYYGGQVLRFAAAFLTGLVVLALLPGLRRLRLDTGANLLVAGGVGLVTLVAVPVIAVIVGLTLIGLPLALLALLVWLAAIYLSKVVLAHLIGARILDAANNPRHFTVALLVGLLAVIILVELPFIGGLLNFLLTICGLGLLVLFGWRGYRREPAAGAV